MVEVARVALDPAAPAGVRVLGGQAVQQLVHDPYHEVVRGPQLLEVPRDFVEPPARHRVQQALALVDVVGEPDVFGAHVLRRAHALHLHYPGAYTRLLSGLT